MTAARTADFTATLARLKTALSCHDRAETNSCVGRLLDERAPLGEQWRAISHLMQVSGELTLALRAIDAFIAASKNKPMARYAKVVLLIQAHRQHEAHNLLKALPDDVPDRGGRAYVLGNTAITLGRLDEGRAYLLKSVDYRPGWGPAWLSLANAGNIADDPIGDRMLTEAAAAEQHGQADLARFCYAVGKLYSDRGDTGAAFASYARGAGLLKLGTPYNRAANATNARLAMTGFTIHSFDRGRKSEPANVSRPIFVTGLPRSGTTLVEHILASHSQVHDGGELNIIQQIAVAAGGTSGEALARYVASGGETNTLGNLYLHLLSERFGPAGRIVDKTIDASRFLGLIATALPDAPLVWMRRDPLDNAWSCFRTFFIHGVAWSYSFSDIAHHFNLEDQLLLFWKTVLGDRLLVVPFTELVDAPALWTSRLLKHCGLAEEAGPYAPHLTKRRVSTASSLQVRRPINREGVGVAEHYRELMRTFVEKYKG
ncbi:sulfotransferase [Sphingomonas sp. GC_Shp_3]|uniref:tetratricopeptide repeat-containing sulfotransferase family protein n=1 Tax=Sphingomonas sp. GC_Shp_3 TaxID=2937383 RepID=UPI00226A19B7|nr:sulfotransferase [Sphingomonas sp. GC_Shp_3]